MWLCHCAEVASIPNKSPQTTSWSSVRRKRSSWRRITDSVRAVAGKYEVAPAVVVAREDPPCKACASANIGVEACCMSSMSSVTASDLLISRLYCTTVYNSRARRQLHKRAVPNTSSRLTPSGTRRCAVHSVARPPNATGYLPLCVSSPSCSQFQRRKRRSRSVLLCVCFPKAAGTLSSGSVHAPFDDRCGGWLGLQISSSCTRLGFRLVLLVATSGCRAHGFTTTETTSRLLTHTHTLTLPPPSVGLTLRSLLVRNSSSNNSSSTPSPQTPTDTRDGAQRLEED